VAFGDSKTVNGCVQPTANAVSQFSCYLSVFLLDINVFFCVQDSRAAFHATFVRVPFCLLCLLVINLSTYLPYVLSSVLFFENNYS
jgi:hypothetical protein